VKAGDNDAVQRWRRDEGWDETILVWNGTVARIAVADLEPAGDVVGVDVERLLERDVNRLIELAPFFEWRKAR
jgi:hypothetical protein